MMMCGFCCIALLGVLYAILVHTLNHFLPRLMGRYIWLEVVGGVGLTILCLWLFVGETVHIKELLIAFGLTGGPMAMGSLVRQLIADRLAEDRREEPVRDGLS